LGGVHQSSKYGLAPIVLATTMGRTYQLIIKQYYNCLMFMYGRTKDTRSVFIDNTLMGKGQCCITKAYIIIIWYVCRYDSRLLKITARHTMN